jgi:iron complex outermembrane receptor protein
LHTVQHPFWPLAALAGLIFAGAAWAGEPPPAPETATEPIPKAEVERLPIGDFHNATLLPSEQSYPPLDPAALLKYAPGATVNSNGPLTGLSQYRGMSGPRVNTLVNGLNVSPACPNWMDPPLSFIPTGDLHEMVVLRGIAPVSAGSEAIGGTIRANARQGGFGTDEQFDLHGIIGAGGQTVGSGYSGNALLWLSNDHHRFQLSGVYLRGDDFEAGRGDEVVPTEYRRWNAGLGYGFRNGAQRAGLFYFFDDTRDTGTPALPMDIHSVDMHTFRAEYQNTFGPVNVEARFHYIDGSHQMDNFSVRSPPRNTGDMRMRRLSEAEAKDRAYDVRGSTALGGGQLRFGTDGWLPENQADILNPDNPTFEIVNFNDVKRNRFGFFGEWEGEPVEKWNLTAGLRYTRVDSDAGRVSAAGLGMNQGNADELAAAFNSSDRSRQDNLFDVALVLRRNLTDTTALEFGLARKQRAPSYQERYLWLPLEATAGLADGRNYVGDLDLDPETSYHFDLGLSSATEHFYFTPRLFYKRVDDYIQGAPLSSGPAVAFRHMAADMIKGGGYCQANPATAACVPLQFRNVDAELYGADVGFGVAITGHWRMDGTVSYVYGKRRDIDDDLYRIAPPNAVVDLTCLGRNWSVTAEGEFALKQDNVSEVSAEQDTDGYALLHLYGQYTLKDSLKIRAGVRNVFDSFYQSHVAGINRVIADADGDPIDLDVGERLPGPGRNFFIHAEYRF